MVTRRRGRGRPPADDAGRRRGHLLVWTSVVFTSLVVVVIAIQGGELRSTIARFPAWAALGAAGAHLCWLACRGEAWRLALNAVGPRRVPPAPAHAANALAVAIGALHAVATVPTRALALRRLAPERSPTLEQTLVADAPVLTLEATLMGALLVAVVATAPALPGWGAGAVLGTSVGAPVALAVLRDRLGGRGLAAGLRVIGDRRRRVRLLGLTALMSGLGLSRAWFVLAGFDLPHGFAGVTAFLAALGIAAVLPIGLAANPAAALAVFGASDATLAAAAGVGMAAASLIAVIAYGVLSLSVAALGARRWARRAEAGLPETSAGQRAESEAA